MFNSCSIVALAGNVGGMKRADVERFKIIHRLVTACFIPCVIASFLLIMKRFIDLGDQTGNIDYEAGEREFAFYCTVRDIFETFSGSQTWNTRQEFIEDYKGDELERFLGLIPLNWL